MPDNRNQYKSSLFSKDCHPEDEEESLSDNDEQEVQRWREIQTIQKKVFEAVCAESKHQLESVLFYHNPSLILQVLVTFTYPNHDGLFHHDHDILKDAAELLGPSVLNLNALQSACMLGEEDLAIDIIDYVAQQSNIMSTKKVLYEFMSKVWGSGNTILHLASFMGMSNLVKRLIDLGANTNKRNERKYKAVDCADDDITRALFLNLKEVVRYPVRRTMSVDGNSPRRRESCSFEPVFTKNQEKAFTLQRSKAISSKKLSDFKPRRGSHNEAAQRLSIVEEDIASVFGDGSLSPPNLARAKSLGFSSGSESSESLDSCDFSTEGSSPKKKLSEKNTKRRVIFDAKTLALDYAKTGDYIELKRILENENFLEILLIDGEKSVFDIATRHLRLSLLHLASSYNHLSICQYLIENGAFVNPKDREGWTPIHCAAAEGHDTVVRFLLSVPSIVIHTLNVDDESPCDVAANEHIRGMLKEKLVRRISLDFNPGSAKSLDESLCELQRATKIITVGKGGDSGLLRPNRSLSHHRATAPTKPFSPPHSFSKPLDSMLSSSPPKTVLPIPTSEPSNFILQTKSYQFSFASF